MTEPLFAILHSRSDFPLEVPESIDCYTTESRMRSGRSLKQKPGREARRRAVWDLTHTYHRIFKYLVLTGASCNDEKLKHIGHPRAETQIILLEWNANVHAHLGHI